MAGDVQELSPEDTGFVWEQPTRLRVAAAALVGASLVVVAAGVFAVFRYGDPTIPSRFDHGAWVKHSSWRAHMLSDVLTNKICAGTTYGRVEALLGRPTYTLPARAPGVPSSLVYKVGLADPLYIDFKRTRSNSAVVYSVLPPFWPKTGCWS